MFLQLIKYFFIAVGIRSIIIYLYENYKTVFQLFVSYFREKLWPTVFPRNLKIFGEWAVVTGATDGIGKQYAKELASKRLNIILMARNYEKLMKVATEIKNEFQIQVECIQVDFSNGRQIYDDIRKKLCEYEVGILVNNVGTTSGDPKGFIRHSEDDIWDMINVNIATATIMSKIVLHDCGMLKRRKGAIINISSMAQSFPCPYIGVYSATKAYLKFLTTTMQLEFINYPDIKIQLISPGFVATNMINSSKYLRYKNRVIVESVESFAKQCVWTLGRCDSTTGCLKHEISMWIMNLFPTTMKSFLIAKMFRLLGKKLKQKHL